MDSSEFWALIADHVARDEDDLPTVDALEAALAELDAEEIESFDEIFSRLYFASYNWDLWGAAHLINGGCSDDGFDYFRGWLIAMGQDVYEAAMDDPDTLADVLEEDGVECEDMLYVASHAYEIATGDDELPGNDLDYPDIGDGWDFDDDEEMERRYPRLYSKFANND